MENTDKTAIINEEPVTANTPEAPAKKHNFEPIKAGAVTAAKTTGLVIAAGAALFAVSALSYAGAYAGRDLAGGWYRKSYDRGFAAGAKSVETAPAIETSIAE